MKALADLSREWASLPILESSRELCVGKHQVMQSWELPLMRLMAKEVTARRGDVLEIGFGMGISAQAIIDCGCRSYTVIENHPVIADKARRFLQKKKIKWSVIEGSWQEVVGTMKKRFDGIFFDTYPLHEEERSKNHFPFIPLASTLLNPKGIFTYYSDETRSFRAEHLDILLKYFTEVKLIVVDGLRPFEQCEYWKEDHMVVPVAVKR